MMCNIVKTNRRETIKDLDKIPFLDRSLIDYDYYFKFRNHTMFYNTIPLFTTRGCPYHCAYCHSIWPQQHVYRTAENILEEVKLYYDMGIKRFAFLDDIFNLNRKNSEKFYETIIKENINIQIMFQNGVRGDILDKDYIDLMVQAGTSYIPMALETASPRLQKMINKNLNIDKLHENLSYLCEKYPEVISSLYFMVGFPTETEEEAISTIEFVESIKWLHTPEYFNLIIYQGTEMEKIAIRNGISPEVILKSMSNSTLDEEPLTFPFRNKDFAKSLRRRFYKHYWMNKDRIEKVIHGEMKQMTEKEMVLMYNDWFGINATKFNEILDYFSIPKDNFINKTFKSEAEIEVNDFQLKIENYFNKHKVYFTNGLKILLIDVTLSFHQVEQEKNRYIIPPMGILFIATYLKDKLKNQVHIKIAKENVDYCNMEELKDIVKKYGPDVIGLSTVTMFKKNMHAAAACIKENFDIPVIVGGAHSGSYLEILQDKNVDIVSIGEGEVTWLELVNAFIKNNNKLPDIETLKTIDGIAFRDGEVMEGK
ncbi:radical SAM protein [Anaerocolumna sp. AGMB13025]|uniref:B12-binding domain-containing radical SAM protein n=1 Tax=Anaerocolumna sp. AGMB13025 TaxID=3039116 RepID=UPI00241FB096|nr:radical SAM protein [Anaerocolumna sp. AGMB13025]WFR57117.1 radical SAM protein [Anaerocolumna sp. AGMB13025]